MYKLYKMQRTLKADVKTQQTANGTDVSEGGHTDVCGVSQNRSNHETIEKSVESTN